jgi:uncharacterized protein (DUF4415 family)
MLHGTGGYEFFLSARLVRERRLSIMNGLKRFTTERIAAIKAFEDTDISDCPEMTEEELGKLRPRHPEYFRPVKKAVQIRLDADVLAWFRAYGKGYQSRINTALRNVMQQNMRG